MVLELVLGTYWEQSTDKSISPTLTQDQDKDDNWKNSLK